MGLASAQLISNFKKIAFVVFSGELLMLQHSVVFQGGKILRQRFW
jgi:hypothetical protein